MFRQVLHRQAASRFHFGLTLSIVLPLLATAPRAPAGDDSAASKATSKAPIVELRVSYQSQGKTISVERFAPADAGKKCPAVIVLPGSGGMLVGGPIFREFARELARHGYVAQIVHYFDLTGTFIADRPTMEKQFPVWLVAVADGVSDLARHPQVDSKRIGVAGFSLGGYLSLGLATFDPRVSAVVDYFGGMPEPLRKDLRSLPPTLILHGDADKIVPVAEAKALEEICREKNIVHEVRIYAGQGHFILGDDGRDATQRALRFLDTHLKQTPTRHVVARPKLEYLPPGQPVPEIFRSGELEPGSRD